MEYNEAKDKVYCFCCYLFKPTHEKQANEDSFIDEDFRNWKKKFKLVEHVRCVNSAQYEASNKCRDFVNQDQHIQFLLFKQLSQTRSEYIDDRRWQWKVNMDELITLYIVDSF